MFVLDIRKKFVKLLLATKNKKMDMFIVNYEKLFCQILLS